VVTRDAPIFQRPASGISNLNSTIGTWASQNDPLNLSAQAQQRAADPLGAAVHDATNAAFPAAPAGAFAYDTAKSTVESAVTIGQHPQTADDELQLATNPVALGGAATVAAASALDPQISRSLSNAIEHPDTASSSALSAMPGAREENELAKDPETSKDVAGALGNLGSTVGGDGIAKVGFEVAKVGAPIVASAAAHAAGPEVTAAFNAAKSAAVDAFHAHVAPHLDRLMGNAQPHATVGMDGAHTDIDTNSHDVNVAQTPVVAARGERPHEITDGAQKRIDRLNTLFEKHPEFKAKLDTANLPTSGEVPFLPPKSWKGSTAELEVRLPGGKKGYRDRDGMVWTQGDSRTFGQENEWDIQKPQNGTWPKWVTDAGYVKRNHINVSLDGKVTH
jgi:hypothetical protein